MTAAERTVIRPALVKPAPGGPRRTVPDVDIRICLGTGGVAAGSREVLKAFERSWRRPMCWRSSGPARTTCAGRCASVTGTGCQGLCAMDPLVEVHMGQNGSQTHRSPTARSPRRWWTRSSPKHIVGGEPIEKWIVRTDEGETEYDASSTARRSSPCATWASSIRRRSRTTWRPTATRLSTRSCRA